MCCKALTLPSCTYSHAEHDFMQFTNSSHNKEGQTHKEHTQDHAACGLCFWVWKDINMWCQALKLPSRTFSHAEHDFMQFSNLSYNQETQTRKDKSTLKTMLRVDCVQFGLEGH